MHAYFQTDSEQKLCKEFAKTTSGLSRSLLFILVLIVSGVTYYTRSYYRKESAAVRSTPSLC